MRYLALVLIIAGCASVPFLPVKTQDFTPLKGDEKITLIKGTVSPIHIAGLRDNTGQGNVWGEGRSGIKYTKTPLVGAQDNESFLIEYLSTSFAKRGINIVTLADASASVMTVEVNRFWVEEVIEKYKPETARCNIAMQVNLDRGSKHYTGEFYKSVQSSGNLGDGTEKLVPTMASCLNLIVEEMIKSPEFTNFLRQ